MIRRLLPVLAILVLLVSACAKAPTQPKPAPKPAGCEAAAPVADWLAGRALPLTGVTAGAGFKDLQGLKKALDGVRVVALGEQTHGTREFFTMKHRMVEFLVTEMGFTTFGIEAAYPLVEQMNRYVLTGEGDPRAAVIEMGFWTWQTQEVFDLATWMRAYNERQPAEKRVSFVGFDVQHASSAHPVLDFLRDYAPDAPEEFNRTVQRLLTQPPVREYSDRQVTDESRADGQTLTGLLAYLVTNRARLEAASGKEAYQRALNMARNFHRYHAFIHQSTLPEASAVRDRGMADTVVEFLEQMGPQGKMVLWAHNLHVADKEPWMGLHLRKALGQQYYAMGFAFDHGSFRALDNTTPSYQMRSHVITGPEANSIEWHLACAGLGNAIIDFRVGDRPPAVTDWLKQERPMRTIGAVYRADEDAKFIMPIHPTAWDALIYIPETTPSVPLH